MHITIRLLFHLVAFLSPEQSEVPPTCPQPFSKCKHKSHMSLLTRVSAAGAASMCSLLWLLGSGSWILKKGLYRIYCLLMAFQPLPAVSSNVMTFKQSIHQILKSSVRRTYLSDIFLFHPLVCFSLLKFYITLWRKQKEHKSKGTWMVSQSLRWLK